LPPSHPAELAGGPEGPPYGITRASGPEGPPYAITRAEAAALSLVAALSCTTIAVYFFDRAGAAFTPARMLVVTIAAGVSCLLALWRGAEADAAGWTWIAVFASAWGWLLWLARPSLLPLGSGPDLTHHLQLVRFIEQHWTLVHEPPVEWWLGEMVQYTPGSQALIALAGAWTGRDGLHALHPFVAAAVALKWSILLLIVLRLLAGHRGAAGGRVAAAGVARIALAVAGVLMLGFPLAYAIGAFAQDSFIAQVVAELYVVAMWWTLAAWDERPSLAPAALFAIFGAAAFLTWPVLAGAPMLAAAIVMLVHDGAPLHARVRDAAAALSPIVAVASVYFIGRVGWLSILATGGKVLHPSVSEYTPWFLAASIAGVIPALFLRRARATLVFTAAVLAEAAALFAAARTRGTGTPYMALKMFYLLVYPQAALAALACAAAVDRLSVRIMSLTRTPVPALLLAVSVGAASFAHARTVIARPLSEPAITEPLARAADWVAAHGHPGCVEYLVADANTAYWLHLAALGNRRMSARTADASTFELRDALVRWLTPGGLEYAIVERHAIPAGIDRELDVAADFGDAVVARRKGAAACPDDK
jgi:hypothetical protein